MHPNMHELPRTAILSRTFGILGPNDVILSTAKDDSWAEIRAGL